MRFLANENLSLAVVQAIRDGGHDTAWIRTDRPGAQDDDVLALARAEGRVLVTFDKDFGEMVFRRGAEASPGVVLFRLPVMPPDALARAVASALDGRSDWRGQFSIVEVGRVRMRKLPVR